MVTAWKFWSQDFGVPHPTARPTRAPEVRKYTLEKANYLRTQLRMYVQVSDERRRVCSRWSRIGKTVSFSDPETQLDRVSNLHVLWQSGGAFSPMPW